MSFLLCLFNSQPSKHLRIRIIQLGLMRLTQSEVMCIKVKDRRPWCYAFLGGYGVFNINVYYWIVWRRTQAVPFHQGLLLVTLLQRSSLGGVWNEEVCLWKHCHLSAQIWGLHVSHSNLKPCQQLKLQVLCGFVTLTSKLLDQWLSLCLHFPISRTGKTILDIENDQHAASLCCTVIPNTKQKEMGKKIWLV